MSWNIPLPESRVLETLARAEADTVYDLGCGSGELAGILARRGLQVHGIDLDAELIAQARGHAPEARFTVGDAASTPWPKPVGLAICLGSSHAWGPGEAALTGLCATLSTELPKGGWALIGEGFHRPPMPPAYAEMIGSPSGIERTHGGNVTEIERHGLVCRHAITATQAEWDDFEWAFFRRKGRTAWRDAYLQWGREVMGFGLYLAQRV